MSNNTLQLVLNKQTEFQKKFGYNGAETDISAVSALIHTHAAFLNEETIEMLRELPFHKPWRDYSNWDREKIVEQFSLAREEWTDMFIFLMNIAVFLNLDEDSIKELYLEKLGLNHKRQEDPKLGYVNGGVN